MRASRVKTHAIGFVLISSAGLGHVAAQNRAAMPTLNVTCGDRSRLGAGTRGGIIELDSSPCSLEGPAASPSAVSVRTLEHKPPKQARKEFDQGIQAWRHARTEDALNHLTAAVRADPYFLSALIEL